MKKLLSLIIIVAAAELVSAWGALGHATIAFTASNFVAPGTKTFFQNLLNDTTTSYLASVASWADSYRYTKGGAFSEPYHFIDAKDTPPGSCGVNYTRDCDSKGCVVSAITNYTARISDASLSEEERYIAAKFIIHFVGDIHQPLHDENLDLGGNEIPVNFSSIPTNLHAIWDTNMPEKLIGGYSLTLAHSWATTLTASIQGGTYKSEAASWLDDIDITDPKSTSLKWAEEANKYVCSTVLKGGVSAVKGKELDGSYYDAAVPVFELQIARAGYRLAKWLDLIAAAATSSREDLGVQEL